MRSKRPDAYLLAVSMRHAHLTAEIDWHWPRIGVDDFRSPEGERVRCVSDGERLRGLERGTPLYLGFEWHKARDAMAIVDAGRFTIKYGKALDPALAAHDGMSESDQ